MKQQKKKKQATQYLGRTLSCLVFSFFVAIGAEGVLAQVVSHQKISDTEGGFSGMLHNGDGFGRSVASLRDLDGDGVGELAVGASGDRDGVGAVWVLFLDMNGAVKGHLKIGQGQGGFTGILDGGVNFVTSVASLGDLDDDGVGDLAVGAIADSDGGFERGAVWVLFLDTNGTVKRHQKSKRCMKCA